MQSFKFECLKWPILAEITAKSAIYSHFFCQQGGDIPPCGPERGGPDPPGPLPGGNPDIDDKNVFLVDNAHTKSQ